jgi:peroxiredoxin
MTRLRLVPLLLLGAFTAGCSQSSAVPSAAVPSAASSSAAVPSAALSNAALSSTGKPSLPAKTPRRHTVRKVIVSEPSSSTIPQVCLSTLHAKWCVAKVGDSFPPVELPRLGGPKTKLATLYGKQATVVLFWRADRWMSRMALEDLVSFVVGEYDSHEVAVVGIAVRQQAGAAQRLLNPTKAAFPQLLDTNGEALAQVGSVALPRLYVLDPAGKIVWFDIEYSESTRRELAQTLTVLTGNAK